MSSKWRRFEVLLPLQFNDGRDVPTEWLAEAVLEVVAHFGAASYETQKLEGHWRHGGVLYRDNLVRLVADVADTADSRQWMREFKGRWKSRLEQVDLWMVSYPNRSGIARMEANVDQHGHRINRTGRLTGRGKRRRKDRAAPERPLLQSRLWIDWTGGLRNGPVGLWT